MIEFDEDSGISLLNLDEFFHFLAIGFAKILNVGGSLLMKIVPDHGQHFNFIMDLVYFNIQNVKHFLEGCVFKNNIDFVFQIEFFIDVFSILF